jgi:hypothetical protein
MMQTNPFPFAFRLSAFHLIVFASGCQNLDLTLATNAPGLPEQVRPPETPGQGTLHLPSLHEKRVAPFIFLSDLPLNPEPKWIQSCSQLRDQVARDLKLQNSQRPILVYLFGDRASYDQYMRQRYPELPSRRAFFVAQGRSRVLGEDLMVLTWWSDRLEQDLRHELTHALLHSTLMDVPLWLDEGLAEYYEMENFPVEFGERLSQTREDFARGPGPNLNRLEEIREINRMQRPEYRESWLWTRYLLQGQPELKPVLLEYLGELRQNPRPMPLTQRLAAKVPDYQQRFARYASEVAAPRTPVPPPP